MLKKGSLTVREEVIEDAVLASEMLKNDPKTASTIRDITSNINSSEF